MPIMDAHGIVTSILGVSRDITERKEAESASKTGGEQEKINR
jgi:hypothetical protein